jgi:hypothetical protein
MYIEPFLSPVLLMIVCIQLWIIASRIETLIGVAREGQK